MLEINAAGKSTSAVKDGAQVFALTWSAESLFLITVAAAADTVETYSILKSKETEAFELVWTQNRSATSFISKGSVLVARYSYFLPMKG